MRPGARGSADVECRLGQWRVRQFSLGFSCASKWLWTWAVRVSMRSLSLTESWVSSVFCWRSSKRSVEENGVSVQQLDRRRQGNPARRTATRLRAVASRRDAPPAPAPAARECAPHRRSSAPANEPAAVQCVRQSFTAPHPRR